MEKQLLTPMVVETTTESSIKLPMERQIGTVQRPKLVSFRGITIGITTNKTEGSGNNRPNHQQNNNGITCYACNQPRHIVRNCPLIQRGNNSQQNNNRQVHFQQGKEGSQCNQKENTENSEGNIFNATQLFQGQCNYDNNFHLQKSSTWFVRGSTKGAH